MSDEERRPEITSGDLYKDPGKEIIARFQVRNQILHHRRNRHSTAFDKPLTTWYVVETPLAPKQVDKALTPSQTVT